MFEARLLLSCLKKVSWSLLVACCYSRPSLSRKKPTLLPLGAMALFPLSWQMAADHNSWDRSNWRVLLTHLALKH